MKLRILANICLFLVVIGFIIPMGWDKTGIQLSTSVKVTSDYTTKNRMYYGADGKIEVKDSRHTITRNNEKYVKIRGTTKHTMTITEGDATVAAFPISPLFKHAVNISFLLAHTGIIMGILLILKRRPPVGIEWLTTLATFIGVMIAFGIIRGNLETLQIGAKIILICSTLALVFQIVSAVLSRSSSQASKPAFITKSELVTAWKLIKPYWVSKDKWAAWSLFGVTLVLDFAYVAIANWFNYWNRNLWNALQNYEYEKVLQLILFQGVLIAGARIVSEASRTWFFQTLQMRWRRWLNDVYMKNWLTGSTFHRIESTGKIDNSDQRIQEDLRDMTYLSLHLTLGFVKNLAQLISFSVIIWGLSGTLSFAISGLPVNIPGNMLYISILYAVIASLAIEKWGKRLVDIDYEQQIRESDFRYMLARIRENSAQIAISSGGKLERGLLTRLFGGILANWRLVKNYTLRVNFVEKTYTEFGIILANLLIISRYFAKQVQMGAFMQLSMAFTNVRVAFAWYVFQFQRLASVRSMFNRLNEFTKAFTEVNAGDIVVNKSSDKSLHVDNLTLKLPDGAALTRIGSLQIDPGSRWLIKGDSGVGKTTFLRAISGLWSYGNGTISLPEVPEGKMMFLPQESYMPLGNLKTALCYPEEPESFTNEQCAKVMNMCGLSPYVESLEVADIKWSKKLSPGEKQRLAFARAILLQPEFLFMDEATSAIDLRMEQHCFAVLFAELQKTTIINVAHRPSVEQYHDNVLEMGKVEV